MEKTELTDRITRTRILYGVMLIGFCLAFIYPTFSFNRFDITKSVSSDMFTVYMGAFILAAALWYLPTLISDVDSRTQLRKAAGAFTGIFVFFLIFHVDTVLTRKIVKLWLDIFGFRYGIVAIFIPYIGGTIYMANKFSAVNYSTDIKGTQPIVYGLYAMAGAVGFLFFGLLTTLVNNSPMSHGNMSLLKDIVTWLWYGGILACAAGFAWGMLGKIEYMSDDDEEEDSEGMTGHNVAITVDYGTNPSEGTHIICAAENHAVSTEHTESAIETEDSSNHVFVGRIIMLSVLVGFFIAFVYTCFFASGVTVNGSHKIIAGIRHLTTPMTIGMLIMAGGYFAMYRHLTDGYNRERLLKLAIVFGAMALLTFVCTSAVSAHGVCRKLFGSLILHRTGLGIIIICILLGSAMMFAGILTQRLKNFTNIKGLDIVAIGYYGMAGGAIFVMLATMATSIYILNIGRIFWTLGVVASAVGLAWSVIRTDTCLEVYDTVEEEYD